MGLGNEGCHPLKNTWANAGNPGTSICLGYLWIKFSLVVYFMECKYT